jgi:hypothetical protein
MGVVNGIDAVTFPAQGAHLHAEVRVCFRYDTSRLVGGIIVRDDAAEPWRTIIRLDDGRFVLGTECQYTLTGDAR